MCACFLLVLAGLFADDSDGYIDPTLGGFVISQSESIEMTEEVVEIWEDHVKVTFWFTNLEDSAQTATIGFPVDWGIARTGVVYDKGDILTDSPESLKTIEDYYHFTSTCNGEDLPRTLVPSVHKATSEYDTDLFDFWFTAELSFEPHEVLEVVDEYDYGPSYWGDSTGHYGRTWPYVLTTGSTWADAIKRATIIFHTNNNVTWDNFQYVFDMKQNVYPKYTVHGNDLYFSEKMIWDINTWQWYGYVCTYNPVSIEKDSITGETVITWELLNLKPENDWLFTRLGREAGDWYSTDFVSYIPYLLREEYRIRPEAVEQVGWRAEDLLTYDSEWVEKNLRKMSVTEFSEMIFDLYNAGFSDNPEKTEMVSVYAQFLINSVYAMHRYKFTNQKWTDIFEHFYWYRPVYTSVDESSFTEKEREMIERLKEFR